MTDASLERYVLFHGGPRHGDVTSLNLVPWYAFVPDGRHPESRTMDEVQCHWHYRAQGLDKGWLVYRWERPRLKALLKVALGKLGRYEASK